MAPALFHSSQRSGPLQSCVTLEPGLNGMHAIIYTSSEVCLLQVKLKQQLCVLCRESLCYAVVTTFSPMFSNCYFSPPSSCYWSPPQTWALHSMTALTACSFPERQPNFPATPEHPVSSIQRCLVPCLFSFRCCYWWQDC